MQIRNDIYLGYKNGKKDFICQYCTDCSWLKCAKYVYDREPGIFAVYATFGFTGHVQVLVRRNIKIHKIQAMISSGSVGHAKYICFLSLSWQVISW